MKNKNKRMLFLWLICLAIFFVLSCSSGGSSNDSNNSSTPTPTPTPIVVQDYTAKQLPAKFIAVTAFTSGSLSTTVQRLDFVKSVAEKTKENGLQAVNLAVDWCDIESTQGVINFDALEKMIKEIKSRGLFCILRIYVNVGGMWQAWPDWLKPLETYDISGKREILPWDSAYQTAWQNFQEQLYSKFISNEVQPDAIQITLGGSFGEQVLGEYDSSGWVWSNFTDTLFDSEKWHVYSYMQSLGKISKSHIIMVNSLSPLNPDYEDEVAKYAYEKGVSWVQLNTGACFLLEKDYGPDNAKMIARAHDRGSSIFLEDESGNWSCSEVGLSSSLSDRVAYMKQIQKTYSFLFSSVSISNKDLDDLSGIADLKSMLGL